VWPRMLVKRVTAETGFYHVASALCCLMVVSARLLEDAPSFSFRTFAAFGLPIMVKNSTRVVFDHVIDSKLVPRRVSAEHSQPWRLPIRGQKLGSSLSSGTGCGKVRRTWFGSYDRC